MLLSLRDDQKQHLAILISQPTNGKDNTEFIGNRVERGESVTTLFAVI